MNHVEQHGVAYSGAVGGGGKDDVSEVLTARSYKGIGARNGEISGAFAAAKVQCYENHGQDSRVKPIEVSDTRNQKDGTGGNNLPLVVHTPFVKTSHAKGKNGDGEKWEQCELAGTRNAIEGGDGRNQECIVSTNSNGEDVAPTISQSEYRMGQNQKDTGGGYVITRMEKEGAKGE